MYKPFYLAIIFAVYSTYAIKKKGKTLKFPNENHGDVIYILLILYATKRNPPPQGSEAFISKKSNILGFLHEIGYVGVRIFSWYFESFLKVFFAVFSL